jgi:hypothetical protein
LATKNRDCSRYCITHCKRRSSEKERPPRTVNETTTQFPSASRFMTHPGAKLVGRQCFRTSSHRLSLPGRRSSLSGFFYEQLRKRLLKGIHICGCHCNERLKVKTDRSTLQVGSLKDLQALCVCVTKTQPARSSYTSMRTVVCRHIPGWHKRAAASHLYSTLAFHSYILERHTFLSASGIQYASTHFTLNA